MNPGEFKLSIHGGLWPICEYLDTYSKEKNVGVQFVILKDGSGYICNSLYEGMDENYEQFNSIDDLIDLLVVTKQEEAQSG